MRRVGVIFGGVVVATVVGLAPNASSVNPNPRGFEGTPASHRADLRPGDVVQDVGVGARVPPAGRGVIVHAHGPDHLEGLRIETLPNGDVHVFGMGQGKPWEPEAVATDSGGGGGSGQCNEDGKNQQNFMERNTHPWYFNASSTPTSDISADSAQLAIAEAGRNWAQLNNACGYSDDVWASFSYKGTTNLGANISGDGSSCLGDDGYNVVSFGNLASNQDGVECSYYVLEAGWDELYESDIKLNSYEETWTVAGNSSSCSNRADVEAVMTHERGHTLGFGHVNNDINDHLTMSAYLEGDCQISERSLGWGDIRAIREKYQQ